MAVDKNYCMSSYLAFRYIEDDSKDFFSWTHHKNVKSVDKEQRVPVFSADQIDIEIEKQIDKYKEKKKGLFLSGGMDSAIIASYLTGSDAYTFRFLDGSFQREESQRAEYFADYYKLNLHYVDINWDVVLSCIDELMEQKGAPVHSIEPQLFLAAKQAKDDGVEMIFTGEGSDLTFGGLDGLLSQDWTIDDFIERFTFTKPEDVLKQPVSMRYAFERYKGKDDKINYIDFLNNIYSEESTGSYYNPFTAAGMPYYEPYSHLKPGQPLNIKRIREGESKYLIRELMKKKYPDIEVPNKRPMPRPVDAYFADWEGPKRMEFKKNIDIQKFTGNQKWQIWCLERFLDVFE